MADYADNIQEKVVSIKVIGVGGQGNGGDYWSSTPYGSSCVYYLYFYSGGQDVNINDRNFGYSVRAVLAEE